MASFNFLREGVVAKPLWCEFMIVVNTEDCLSVREKKNGSGMNHSRTSRRWVRVAYLSKTDVASLALLLLSLCLLKKNGCLNCRRLLWRLRPSAPANHHLTAVCDLRRIVVFRLSYVRICTRSRHLRGRAQNRKAGSSELLSWLSSSFLYFFISFLFFPLCRFRRAFEGEHTGSCARSAVDSFTVSSHTQRHHSPYTSCLYWTKVYWSSNFHRIMSMSPLLRMIIPSLRKTGAYVLLTNVACRGTNSLP